MSLDKVANFADVLVSGGYDSVATTITLQTGQGSKLPSSAPYNLVWWDNTVYSTPRDDTNREIVRVTARTGDTLTVIRGQEGTSAVAHSVPSSSVWRMTLGVTAKMITDLDTLTDGLGRVMVVAGLSADQTVTKNVSTRVKFVDSLSDGLDLSGEWSNTSGSEGFTATSPCVVRAQAQVYCASTTFATDWELLFFKNGSPYSKSRARVPGASGTLDFQLRADCAVKLATNDTLDVRVFPEQGGTGTVVISSNATLTRLHLTGAGVGHRL